MKKKIYISENWLIFLWGGGVGEKLTLYQGFGKQRQNTFRELRIFFMDLGRSLHFLGRTDTPWGPHDIR